MLTQQLLQAGKVVNGKQQGRKELTKVMAAHNLPYIAQSAPFGNFKDLYEKSEKAIYTEGPCFLNVLSPCPRGWRYDTPKMMDLCKIAVETCFWPLYEIENGKYKITYMPKEKRPITDWIEAREDLNIFLKTKKQSKLFRQM